MASDPSVNPPSSGGRSSTSPGKTRSQSPSEPDSTLGDTPENQSTETEGTEVQEETSESTPSRETLEETSDLLNRTAEVLNRDLRFNVLPDQNIVQAEVVSGETDEVIRQIPPDELIKLRKRLDAFLGLFIDELR